MATSFHYIENKFYAPINDILSNYITDTATNVIASISPTAKTLLIIYFVMYGIAMIMGQIKEPVIDLAIKIIRLSVIMGIALNIGNYNGFIVEFLWETPDALAGIIAHGYSNPTNNVQFLDSLMSQMYDLGDTFSVSAYAKSSFGIPDLSLLFFGWVIILVGAALTVYGAFLLILSKMALAILLATGPIFILLTMFEPTKKLFDSWFGQCLNSVFMVILISASIKLILTILQNYLTDLTASGVLTNPTINHALPAITASALGLLVMRQMFSLASVLGGGVALSSLGAVGWTYDHIKKLAGSLTPKNQGRSNGAQPASQITGGSVKNTRGMPSSVYRKLTSGNINRISK